MCIVMGADTATIPSLRQAPDVSGKHMTRICTILALTCCLAMTTEAQSKSIELKIDSLKKFNGDIFDCNSIYWRVVALGKEAIPFLITAISDTSRTNTKLPCKKKNVRTGDICYAALTEIFNIPLFYVTNIQFDVIDEHGCDLGVFDYLDRERLKFKGQIEGYYNKYKHNLKLRKYVGLTKSDCKQKNKLPGYYDVDWHLLIKTFAACR